LGSVDIGERSLDADLGIASDATIESRWWSRSEAARQWAGLCLGGAG
jgi:hypothetical protein